MKDRIIEMLERGERVELELADKIGFIEQGASHHVADGLQRGINTVCSVDSDNNVVIRASGLDDMLLAENDCYLKYFKIKEPEYTFNDLIDVAVQAMKDGIIYFRFLSDAQISFSTSSGEDAATFKVTDGAEGISDAIYLINSLYTETFVIESEDHIEMVKLKASVRLTNGNEFIVDNATSKFLTSSTSFEKLTILALKGATVTQKRGERK